MKISEILAALTTLKAADPSVVDSITSDISLEKAAERLSEAEKVKDRWTEGQTHAVASREEIEVGPTQAATGGNTERQIREYSSPAPQHGATLTAEKLGEYLAPLAASSKAHGEAIGALIENGRNMSKALSGIVELITKGGKPADAKAAAKGEDEEDEEDEESEVVEINASRAKARLAKAQSKLRLLKAKKSEMAEEDDEEKCKALKAELKALRKAAGQLLSEAQTFAYAASSAELKAAVRKAASKADINVVQEEEEEDDEEEDAEKAKKALADAAKAKTNDAGHQADRMDPSNGNQAAASKGVTSEELSALKSKLDGISDALTGIAPLRATVNQMMDVVAGKSSPASLVPDISKALGAEANDTKLLETIRDMEDGGTLDGPNAMAARDIVSKFGAVRKGALDRSILDDRLAKAPAAVRSLFANAA